MVIDPVCKMRIDPASAVASLDYRGLPVFFCSSGCRDTFEAAPDLYPVSASESDDAAPDCCSAAGHAAARPTFASVAIAGVWGMFGSGALLGIYFGLLTLLSGWTFTLIQFRAYWPYIVALGIGFGIQVALYAYFRRAVHTAQTGKVMAVSGTTSGVAMVSCCAHYLVNFLPILGATGLASFVGQYQVELFWVGIVANAGGILFMTRRLVTFSRGA